MSLRYIPLNSAESVALAVVYNVRVMRMQTALLQSDKQRF